MASRIMNMKEQLESSLHDTSKPWAKLLQTVEAKTGVDRLYIFIGTVAAVGLWLVFGFAAQLLCNFISFLYPAYISIHAIESPAKDDDTKWLTYWVVFAFFSLLEFFADMIVGWFPLYWLLKCIIFVWLMIPTEFNGSLVIYKKVIKPYFVAHHGAIDSAINRVTATAAKVLEKEN
ncbi:hypothetical protein ILUMI_02143 [Ignelater luminosus]|uniref:Receptor expression-enhancing protein n=1 Tax=Ignelater luminosus TaxID=2038154 RepID=A0A8K0DH02_IGNLU|nr:hypothetical protein ILUMI_02143 [Ignelater luminosus]